MPKDRHDPVIRKAARLAAILAVTPDRALPAFIRSHVRAERVEPEALAHARAILDAVGFALCSERRDDWRRIEEAYAILRRIPAPEEIAGAPAAEPAPPSPPPSAPDFGREPPPSAPAFAPPPPDSAPAFSRAPLPPPSAPAYVPPPPKSAPALSRSPLPPPSAPGRVPPPSAPDSSRLPPPSAPTVARAPLPPPAVPNAIPSVISNGGREPPPRPAFSDFAAEPTAMLELDPDPLMRTISVDPQDAPADALPFRSDVAPAVSPTALAESELAEHGETLGAEPPGPSLTLQQYASLCAERLFRGESASDEVNRRYGLTDPRAFDEHWNRRLMQNPDLHAEFQSLVAHYTQWLAAKHG